MKLLLLLAFLMPVQNLVLGQNNEEKRILEILDKQTKCWNQADVGCFMEGYWKSESLKFIGATGVTYGWQNSLDGYKTRYPDVQAMGKLDFDIIELTPLAANIYMVVGKFILSREIGDLEGYFSLIWKKIDGDWVIISDHTSG